MKDVRWRSQAWRLTALVAVLSLAAACGGGARPRAANAPITTSPVTTGTTEPGSECQTAQLQATVALLGGAGGNYFYRGSLRNISAYSCLLEGFPSLTPTDSSGRSLDIVGSNGTMVTVTSYALTPGESTYVLFNPPAAKPLVLGPNDVGYFDFSYGDNPSGSQSTGGTCQGL